MSPFTPEQQEHIRQEWFACYAHRSRPLRRVCRYLRAMVGPFWPLVLIGYGLLCVVAVGCVLGWWE